MTKKLTTTSPESDQVKITPLKSGDLDEMIDRNREALAIFEHAAREIESVSEYYSPNIHNDEQEACGVVRPTFDFDPTSSASDGASRLVPVWNLGELNESQTQITDDERQISGLAAQALTQAFMEALPDICMRAAESVRSRYETALKQAYSRTQDHLHALEDCLHAFEAHLGVYKAPARKTATKKSAGRKKTATKKSARRKKPAAKRK